MDKGGLVKITCIGDECLEMNNGMMFILRDVKYIHDICLNMIFTSKLDDEGYFNTFSDSQWKLTRGSNVVAQGQKFSTLYLL
jgi:hypothetical protein